MSALRDEKAAQNKMIAELTRRLVEELSARERIVAARRHTKDAVTAMEKLTEKVRQ